MQLKKQLPIITLALMLMISTAQATTQTHTPSSAYDDGGTNVLTKVSTSDDNYAQLSVSSFSSSSYIESNWTNFNIPSAATITSVTYSYEHYESSTSNEDITIEVWDGSNWVQACDAPERSSDTVDTCDLSSYINTPTKASNIAVRYKDTNTGGGFFSTYYTYLDYEKIDIAYHVNHAPTQDNPTLNSTYGTNKSNEELTCYNQSTYDADGDDVKNIYNWYLNSTSITVLNMPFEGGSNSTYTKDYSPYSNDGTPINGTIWHSTWGHDGKGAYYFDGTDDYINAGSSSTLQILGDITISLWANYSSLDSTHTSNSLISEGASGETEETNYPYYLFLDDNKSIELFWENGAGTDNYVVSDAAPINPNEWHHYTVTRNAETKTIKFYVDGNLISTRTYTTSPTGGTSTSLFIGADVLDTTTYNFNGVIDDIFIFNRTLSQQQIQKLSQNQNNKVEQQETQENDVWQCCITPNDLITDGEQKCSNTLTILPAPSITITKNKYYNCNPTMYYQVNFYDSNNHLIQEYASYSIYNTQGIQKNSTQGTAANGIYRGSFYLFGTYEEGQWKLRATTDCYLYQKNFTVTSHLTSEAMKINLYLQPSKIIYTQGEIITARFQVIDANGEGVSNLGSKITADVSGTPLALTDEGDGWYKATIDTTTLTPNNYYVVKATTTNTTATIINSKSFYLKQ